jgi:hypothetical protein
MFLPYRHSGCAIWFATFETIHPCPGVVVGKNKQFYSDCNRGRHFFSFKELREYLEFETDELTKMIGPFGNGLAKSAS